MTVDPGTSRPARAGARLRRRAGALAVDGFFSGMSAAGRLLPRAREELGKLDVVRDVPYRETGREEHRLDVYRSRRPAKGLLPVVVYVHGGGFRILSKDTHWIMALVFARTGYLVFNVGYRLAPRHPFPAAIEDVCAAQRWVVENAARYGGDVDRLVYAGESAGANLVLALAIAGSYERPEPWARAVFDAGVQATAAVPACGMLQVTDPERFRRRKPAISAFVNDRIVEVSRAYLRGVDTDGTTDLDLADPLVALERGEPPARPLPAFFVPCGTKDAILHDSKRLEAALERLGVPHEARYYVGERHAFHAFVNRPRARRCWADTFAFLERVGAGRSGPDEGAAG